MISTMDRVVNRSRNGRAAEPAAPLATGRADFPWRILVVDKNSDVRLLFTDALAGPGCRVDVAEHGAAAWVALQSWRYHLLITENERPNLTGNELLQKLRGAGMDLPVVIVAESLPAHESARHPSLPCAATLLLPFALDALLDTVKNLIRTEELRRVSGPGRRQTRLHGAFD